LKLVFTHENPLIVGNARGVLEAAGIDVVVRNEFAQGGLGELSVFDTWPELWVLADLDYRRAVAVLEASVIDRGEEGWSCDACGETNGAAFELCWHCGGTPS
jgi:hypothetical protein